MTTTPSPQLARTEFGFERTSCACRRCTISCEHVPGALAPPDLPRMAAHLGYGEGDEAVARFAAENLLASEGVAVVTDRGQRIQLPTLVPATLPDGRCKFLDGDRRCTIHAVSPFGCAFIDAHQGDEDFALRADALYRSLHDDLEARGLYSRTWDALRQLDRLALPLRERNAKLYEAMEQEKLA